MKKLRIKVNTEVWKDPERMKKAIEGAIIISQVIAMTNIVTTYIGRDTVTYIFNAIMMIIIMTTYVALNKSWQRKKEEEKGNGRTKNNK